MTELDLDSICPDPDWDPLTEAYQTVHFNSYLQGPGVNLPLSCLPQFSGKVETPPIRTLCVKNVPVGLTEVALSNLFNNCGKVLSVRKRQARFDNNRTIAFVDFATTVEVERAIAHFHDQPPFHLAIEIAQMKAHEQVRDDRLRREVQLFQEAQKRKASTMMNAPGAAGVLLQGGDTNLSSYMSGFNGGGGFRGGRGGSSRGGYQQNGEVTESANSTSEKFSPRGGSRGGARGRGGFIGNGLSNNTTTDVSRDHVNFPARGGSSARGGFRGVNTRGRAGHSNGFLSSEAGTSRQNGDNQFASGNTSHSFSPRGGTPSGGRGRGISSTGRGRGHASCGDFNSNQNSHGFQNHSEQESQNSFETTASRQTYGKPSSVLRGRGSNRGGVYHNNAPSTGGFDRGDSNNQSCVLCATDNVDILSACLKCSKAICCNCLIQHNTTCGKKTNEQTVRGNDQKPLDQSDLRNSLNRRHETAQKCVSPQPKLTQRSSGGCNLRSVLDLLEGLCTMRVMTSNTDGVWVAPVEHLHNLDALNRDICTHQKAGARAVERATNGMVVGLRCKDDRMWYRAVVLSQSPLRLRYIDYGNSEDSPTDMIMLDERKHIIEKPAMALFMRGADPQMFHLDQKLEMRIVTKLSDGDSADVELYSGERFVLDSYIKSFQTSGQNSRQNNSTSREQQPQKPMQTPKGDASHQRIDGSRQQTSISGLQNGGIGSASPKYNKLPPPAFALTPGKVATLYCSWVDDQFIYLQDPDSADELIAIQTEVATVGASASPSDNRSFGENDLVIALWQGDWYRAMVVNPSQKLVHFVDYGNTDVAESMLPMTPSLAQKPPICVAATIDNYPRLNGALLRDKFSAQMFIVTVQQNGSVRLATTDNRYDEIVAALRSASLSSPPASVQAGAIKSPSPSSRPAMGKKAPLLSSPVDPVTYATSMQLFKDKVAPCYLRHFDETLGVIYVWRADIATDKMDAALASYRKLNTSENIKTTPQKYSVLAYKGSDNVWCRVRVLEAAGQYGETMRYQRVDSGKVETGLCTPERLANLADVFKSVPSTQQRLPFVRACFLDRVYPEGARLIYDQLHSDCVVGVQVVSEQEASSPLNDLPAYVVRVFLEDGTDLIAALADNGVIQLAPDNSHIMSTLEGASAASGGRTNTNNLTPKKSGGGHLSLKRGVVSQPNIPVSGSSGVARSGLDGGKLVSPIAIIYNSEHWFPPGARVEAEFCAEAAPRGNVSFLRTVQATEQALPQITEAIQRSLPFFKDAIWDRLKVGHSCYARFAADGCYYRARVLELRQQTGQVLVSYVDFGDTALLSIGGGDVKTGFLNCPAASIPALAVQCNFFANNPEAHLVLAGIDRSLRVIAQAKSSTQSFDNTIVVELFTKNGTSMDEEFLKVTRCGVVLCRQLPLHSPPLQKDVFFSITHVVSPLIISGHLTRDFTKILELDMDLTAYAQGLPPNEYHPEPGQVCFGYVSDSGFWHRVSILETANNENDSEICEIIYDEPDERTTHTITPSLNTTVCVGKQQSMPYFDQNELVTTEGSGSINELYNSMKAAVALEEGELVLSGETTPSNIRATNGEESPGTKKYYRALLVDHGYVVSLTPECLRPIDERFAAYKMRAFHCVLKDALPQSMWKEEAINEMKALLAKRSTQRVKLSRNDKMQKHNFFENTYVIEFDSTLRQHFAGLGLVRKIYNDKLANNTENVINDSSPISEAPIQNNITSGDNINKTTSAFDSSSETNTPLSSTVDYRSVSTCSDASTTATIDSGIMSNDHSKLTPNS